MSINHFKEGHRKGQSCVVRASVRVQNAEPSVLQRLGTEGHGYPRLCCQDATIGVKKVLDCLRIHLDQGPSNPGIFYHTAECEEPHNCCCLGWLRADARECPEPHGPAVIWKHRSDEFDNRGERWGQVAVLPPPTISRLRLLASPHAPLGYSTLGRMRGARIGVWRLC